MTSFKHIHAPRTYCTCNYYIYYRQSTAGIYLKGEGHRAFPPLWWFPPPRISKVYIENRTKAPEHVWFPPPEEPAINNPVLYTALPTRICFNFYDQVKFWQYHWVWLISWIMHCLHFTCTFYILAVERRPWPKASIFMSTGHRPQGQVHVVAHKPRHAVE